MPCLVLLLFPDDSFVQVPGHVLLYLFRSVFPLSHADFLVSRCHHYQIPELNRVNPVVVTILVRVIMLHVFDASS